jgi:dUTPase
MILTSAEIDALAIVANPDPAGKRRTSYDATVGEIIFDGAMVDGQRFRLPSRGIAWVVSRETFRLPDTVTGIATLRTTWTQEGILALTVGVIDPEWSGSLSAAIVNFGSDDFIISKGDQFFRVVFHQHGPTSGPPVINDRNRYIEDTIRRSIRTRDSFLNMSNISDEVSGKLFGSSNWASRITIWLLFLSIMAIFFPIAYGVCSDYIGQKSELSIIKDELKDIKKEQTALSAKVEVLTNSADHRTAPDASAPISSYPSTPARAADVPAILPNTAPAIRPVPPG